MKFQWLHVRLMILFPGMGSREHIMANDLKGRQSSLSIVRTSNVKITKERDQ